MSIIHCRKKILLFFTCQIGKLHRRIEFDLTRIYHIQQFRNQFGQTDITVYLISAFSCLLTDYIHPLAESMADQIKTPTGKDFTSLSYEKVINGELSADDMRIAPETLEMQAQVAESVHREAFAGNLRRAAELIAVPDDRLLEIYNALRPYRSTKQELLDIAGELDGKYGAKTAASLVREAAEVYEKRGRLKKF